MYDISRNVLNISVISNVSEILVDMAFICVATVMQYFLLTRLLSKCFTLRDFNHGLRVYLTGERYIFSSPG